MGTSLLLHVLYGTMMHSIQLFRPISLCFSGTAPLMIGVDADQWDQYTSVIDQCVLFCFFEIQFKPGGAKFKQKSKCFFFFSSSGATDLLFNKYWYIHTSSDAAFCYLFFFS